MLLPCRWYSYHRGRQSHHWSLPHRHGQYVHQKYKIRYFQAKKVRIQQPQAGKNGIQQLWARKYGIALVCKDAAWHSQAPVCQRHYTLPLSKTAEGYYPLYELVCHHLQVPEQPERSSTKTGAKLSQPLFISYVPSSFKC